MIYKHENYLIELDLCFLLVFMFMIMLMKNYGIVIVEDDISLCSSNNAEIFILSTLCL